MKLPFDGLTRRRLYLVRHGESAATRESDGLYGDNIVLTARGLEEARAMATALSEVPFGIAFSSNIWRAQQTARIILEGRGIDALPSRRFTELSGDIAPILNSDRPIIERQKRFAYAMWDAADPDARFFGGDSYERYMSRVARTLARVVRSVDTSDILIVSHSGFQRAALCWALDANPGGLACFEQDTCCLNILDIDVTVDGRTLRKHVRLANYTPVDPVKRESRLTDGEQLAGRFLTAP